jgi:acyl-coenzyme A thioesterase PaaI-like protein
MGLRLHVDGGCVRGNVTFDDRHEGAPGIVHGGAIATVLDDTLGLLLVVLGTPAVTANLSVDYRAPALLQTEMIVERWLEQRVDRKLHLRADLSIDGQPVAQARALFLAVEVAHFEKGGRTLLPNWADWGPSL